MIYIIPNCYEPNTAATNRFLALISGISKCLKEDEKCEVDLFLPNKKRDKIEKKYINIKFNYWWERKWQLKNRYLKYLTHEIAIRLFVRRLRRDDRVLLLGHAELLPVIQKKKGVHVYFEMNELPELFAFGNGFRRITTEQILACCRKLDGLFVISNPLKEYFEQKGVRRSRIHIYNMIVDPSRFEHLRKSTINQKYIAYCGTASNSKDGVDVLIRAFAMVAKSHRDIRLLIVGKTPSINDEKGNYTLIETLGIKGQITFTGEVSAKDMPQILKDAELLVLARPNNIQAKYGFPTKLGEYLLTGNPVVVTNVGDIPFYLKDGESALISEPEDLESISNKIIWALDNPEEATIIGNKGRDVALQEFNPTHEAIKILNTMFTFDTKM